MKTIVTSPLKLFGLAQWVYVTATQSVAHLYKCIRSVSEGQVWANSRQCRHTLETLVQGRPPLVTDWKGQLLLSSREQEIVSGVTEGMKNRKIAGLLNVSEHTVKNHLFRIYERLGISNRAELILYMYRQEPSVAALTRNLHPVALGLSDAGV